MAGVSKPLMLALRFVNGEIGTGCTLTFTGSGCPCAGATIIIGAMSIEKAITSVINPTDFMFFFSLLVRSSIM
jgi:hypothetical protein